MTRHGDAWESMKHFNFNAAPQSTRKTDSNPSYHPPLQILDLDTPHPAYLELTKQAETHIL